jgi:hypothetical protein
MFNDLCWSKLPDVIHDNLQLIVNFINIIVECFHHRLAQTKIKCMDKSNKTSIIVSQNKRNVNIDLKVEIFKMLE